MENKDILKQLYLELSPEDRKKFLSNLPEELKPSQSKLDTDSLMSMMKDGRHAEGIRCPKCGTFHIGPHGKYKENPRYICYDCGKTFSLTSNSIFHKHKKSIDTYLKYIRLMMLRVPIKKAGKMCGISETTSFIWRHKFLDTLQKLADEVKVGGIVEADETYIKLSFKGSRLIHRKPHRRGNDREFEGLSEEFVCIPCAVDRNKHATTETLGTIAKATNLASPKVRHLKNLFEDRIVPDSILCTDKKSEYVPLANQMNLNLLQFKAGRKDTAVIRSSMGTFHINNVNNYHSRFKGFIHPFRGVATKYINNYLNWHNFMNQLKGKNPDETLLKLFVNAETEEKSREVKEKPAIPFKTRYDRFYAVQGIYAAKGKKSGIKALNDKETEKKKFGTTKTTQTKKEK